MLNVTKCAKNQGDIWHQQKNANKPGKGRIENNLIDTARIYGQRGAKRHDNNSGKADF